MRAFFSRPWQQMPSAQFMAVFGPPSQRIGQVLDRFDPAVWPTTPDTPAATMTTFPCAPEESTR